MSRKISRNETDLWLIPKRLSIHQAWCLIDGLIARKYDGKSWNPSVQNNLGVNLKNWGATNNGRNIAQQSVRTLMAFVHYLGFIYIDTNTTPHTINITKAGYKFWQSHKDDIVKVRNLRKGSDKLLYQSDDVSFQLQKLQITNPILEKKCTDILLFPFRTTLRFLRDLNYLDVEELAMYVFKMGADSQYDYVKKKIELFRKLPETERLDIVTEYKKTLFGNITLVKAPSTSYYISLCCASGLVKETSETPLNFNGNIKGLRIKDDQKEIVNNILDEKFKDVEAYYFGDDLPLWIDYYGYTERLYTPVLSYITNKSADSLFIEIIDKNGRNVNDDILDPDNCMTFPSFPLEDYKIKLYYVNSGNPLKDIIINTSKTGIKYEIVVESEKLNCHDLTAREIKDEILEHINNKYFSVKMTKRLNILKRLRKIDKLTDSSLRGAYLEYLFYRLLFNLKENNVIDDVVWNGKIGKYGLPIPAPGGVQGLGDIIFHIGTKCFVLELTTMRSRSSQEKSEASSVPDHVKIYKNQHPCQDVFGIYAPPIIHERVENIMQANAKLTGTRLKSIVINDLLNILVSDDPNMLKELYS